MTQSLRIAVADDEPRMLQFFEMALGQLGHGVVAKAGNGRELVEQCRKLHPDLIITDIKMPDMNGLEAVRQIAAAHVIPVILVSGYYYPESVKAARHDHVLTYLLKPIKNEDLEPAITLVMRRFEEFQALQQQADDLQQAIESRRVIERAKGILMNRAGFTEEDAFRRLRLLSSQKKMKIVEIAEMIVTTEEALS
jgi:two-component system, response regulator PdtaR